MKKILVIAALVLSLVACKPISEQININDWSLESADNLSLGLTQLGFDTNLVLEADNNSSMDIRLTKLYAELYNRSDKLVATVELATAKGETLPVLHRRSSETVAIPLRMNFENPLSILTLAAMSLDDYSEKGYSVTYDCTLKAGCFGKRLQETKVPLATLKKMFEK